MLSPVVHLFFNGDEFVCPPCKAWEKFQGLDAARTFAIAAEAWERNGWQVKRFSTVAGTPYRPTRFAPDGRCAKSFSWYPEAYWQFIAKARTVVRTSERIGALLTPWHLFATMDVIPFNFRPLNVLAAISNCKGSRGISFQREHFSMALLCVTAEWLDAAESILIDYDLGRLPELTGGYISDETILRNYRPAGTVCLSEMTFASNTQRAEFPLCHFSRSAVPDVLNRIQLS